jgi:hypothetical protein
VLELLPLLSPLPLLVPYWSLAPPAPVSLRLHPAKRSAVPANKMNFFITDFLCFVFYD